MGTVLHLEMDSDFKKMSMGQWEEDFIPTRATPMLPTPC